MPGLRRQKQRENAIINANVRKKTVIFSALLFLVLFLSNSHSTGPHSFRFVVMSDSHNTLGNVNSEQVASAIKKFNPDIVLHAGDFTCCLSGKPHNRFRFDEYKLLGGIPVFPTTGNHDYDGNAEIHYDAFWKKHRPGVPINGEWSYTYSFDHKGFHFIAVEWKNPDLAWVEKDLEKNKTKPTIIFSHRAALNKGCKPAFNKKLNAIAKTNPDVKAVFTGHSHCYQKHTIKEGTLQVFTGTVSHDNARDKRFKRKRTFIVVDVIDGNLRICPASVKDGILEGGCE